MSQLAPTTVMLAAKLDSFGLLLSLLERQRPTAQTRQPHAVSKTTQTMIIMAIDTLPPPASAGATSPAAAATTRRFRERWRALVQATLPPYKRALR